MKKFKAYISAILCGLMWPLIAPIAMLLDCKLGHCLYMLGPIQFAQLIYQMSLNPNLREVKIGSRVIEIEHNNE